MDWKREAESKLRSYAARKNSIRRSSEEIERVQASLTGIRSAAKDGTPVSGDCSQLEDALINGIATMDELRRVQAIVCKDVQLIEDALSELDDEERLILDRFYVHRHKGHAERLQRELHLDSTSTVYWKRDKALRHFTLALYGITET